MNRFSPLHIEELVEINSTVRELAESSLLLELSEMCLVLVSHD